MINNNEFTGPKTHIYLQTLSLETDTTKSILAHFGNWSDFRQCPLTLDIGSGNNTLLSLEIVNKIMNFSSMLNISDVTDGVFLN